MKCSLFLSAFLLCALADAQSDQELVEKTVTKNSIAAHLKFISSDALEGRDTPSRGLDVAAEYIRTQLEMMGVRSFDAYPDYYQPVKFTKIYVPDVAEVVIGKQSFIPGGDLIMINGRDMEWSGDFIFLEYATPEELEKADVKGKMIVTNAGNGVDVNPIYWLKLASVKRAAAYKKGAVGVIELYNTIRLPWNFLLAYLNKARVVLDQGLDSDAIPTIWLDNTDRKSRKVFKDKKEPLSVTIRGAKSEDFISHNVVGYVAGNDPKLKDEYVVYSAHYDHVGIGRADATGDSIYNGTRDNAVGTVTVMEAAKNLTQFPTARSSLFVLFVGEEKGLLGSEWFVDHSPIGLDQMVFCFNSDNGGYNDTTIATVIGLERTTAQEHLTRALSTYGLTASNDENFKEQNLFDRSDNVNFAVKGIPAPCFSMGVAQFDEVLMRTYHQPADEFDTINMDYLFNFYRSYVLAGRLIGNAPEAPFWIQGDKYYKGGVQLYGK